MIFTSFEYAGFLLVVVALNWLLPRRFRPAHPDAALGPDFAHGGGQLPGLAEVERPD